MSKYSETNKPNENAPVVEFANAVWYVDNEYKPKDKYKSDVAEIFGADVTYVPRNDFADKVNAWTNSKTRGKIEKIVNKQTAQDKDFKALLENAAYFKSTWAKQFDPKNTKKDTFHNADGTTSQVPFMYNEGQFLYFKGDGFSAVKLNYLGSLSMVVLIQDAQSSKIFEPTEKILDDTIKNMQSRKVSLYLPKFRTEYSLDKELLDYLKPYNMFGTPADEMFTRPDSAKPLVATDIVHKTAIDVDENGTEAAAVTTIMVGTTAYSPSLPVEFRVDRPFYYVIRDDGLNENLFVGMQGKF
jgi:serpin B